MKGRVKRRKLVGVPLKRAILQSSYLPDHPQVFRREQVILALHQDGFTAIETTLDSAMVRLLRQGYLERSKEPDQREFPPSLFYWYRFAKPDRTSDRPGFRPGERYDLWTPS